MSKVLKKVKERFNIFDDGRQHNPAPQQYLLAALKSVIDSPKTKERIGLNEAVGFYGHRIRQLTGKIEPTETEVISVNGKDILVNVVPAVRTVSLDIDEQGNVTHEQEFLDNDMGKTALSLYEQGTGGFSWAMSGQNGHGQPSRAKSFSGFDFVLQPNFLPKSREAGIYASINDDNKDQLLASINACGIEGEQAEQMLSLIEHDESVDSDVNELIIAHLIQSNEDTTNAHEQTLLSIQADVENKDKAHEQLLSSMQDAEQSRKNRLNKVLDNSPFLINDAQKEAFINMDSEEDATAIDSLFAGMKKTDFGQFPSEKNESITVNKDEPISAIPYPSFDTSDHKSFKR